MRTTPILRLLPIAAFGILFAGGCGSDPKDGTVTCSKGEKACPDGYHCAVDNMCWKNGRDPVVSSPDSGMPLDGPGVAMEVGFGSDGIDLAKPIDTGAAIDTQTGLDAARDLPRSDAPADAPMSDLATSDVTNAPDAPSDVALGPDVPTPDGPQCPAGRKPCGDKCIDANGCCAASDCTALCTTCGASNTCVPLVGDDPTKRCTGTCDSTGACKSKIGQACASVGGGCASGSFCAPEGICCDKACTGSCEACDVSGAVGTCKTLAAGAAPHTGHAACVATDAACAGKCDGTGAACAYATASCGAASCNGQVFQAAGTCDTGACKTPAPQTCANACVVATGCSGICTPDALQCKNTTTPQKCSATGSWVDQPACAGGLTCSGGTCACQSPNTTCPAGCVDLQTHASNCGKCGQSCGGAACVAGKCEVVSVTTAVEQAPEIIGLDASYVYYKVRPDSIPMWNGYRVSRTASGVAGTLIHGGGDREMLGNVISTKLLTRNQSGNYICSVASASTCGTSHTTIDYIPSFMPPIPWRHYPEPAYFTFVDDQGGLGYTMEVFWNNPLIPPVRVAQTFDDVAASFRSFMASGNYVYWIRNYNDANVLFSSSSASSGTKSQLATGLSSTVMIIDANPTSILLWDIDGTGQGKLTRLAVGTTGTPTAVVSLATPPATLRTTEDAAGVYYFDADGNLFRCPATGCTTSNKLTIATGQQPNGPLYQDSTYLYWGNASPAMIRRVAKPLP